MAAQSNATKAYPVHSLREQSTALEAAIELVLAKPRKKPVHEIRTHTRRIEALLELLCMLESSTPSLAGLASSARKVKKLLGAIRKAAGKVRDIDVQRALIKDAIAVGAKERTREEAKSLRKTLKSRRYEEAGALLEKLTGPALEVGPRLEKLLERLEPAADLSLSSARLAKLVRAWYSQRTRRHGDSENDLHNIRKAAKVARYMAEAGEVTSIGEEFENIQQLGGGWHDALTLRRVSRLHLGSRSELVQGFVDKEEASLADFRETLGLDRLS